MRINRTGTTRIIIEMDGVVVKIPNILHSWQTFVRGLLSNIDENQTWLFNTGKYEQGKSRLLCPILWCSWGGWVLIMKRVDRVLSHDEYWKLHPDMLKDHLKCFPGDDTGPNYGYISGELVKIDYAQIKYSKCLSVSNNQ